MPPSSVPFAPIHPEPLGNRVAADTVFRFDRQNHSIELEISHGYPAVPDESGRRMRRC
jgi:hypothetical protein